MAVAAYLNRVLFERDQLGEAARFDAAIPHAIDEPRPQPHTLHLIGIIRPSVGDGEANRLRDAAIVELQSLGIGDAIGDVNALAESHERLLNSYALLGDTDAEIVTHCRSAVKVRSVLLRVEAERLKTAAAVAEPSIPPAVLDAVDVEILHAMSEGLLMSQVAIEADCEVSRKTIGLRLAAMLETGLVERPKGPNGGTRITPKGLAVVTKATE